MIYKNDQDIVPMEIDRREEKGIWLVIVPKWMKPLGHHYLDGNLMVLPKILK